MRYKIKNQKTKTLEIKNIKNNRYFIDSIEDDLNNVELFRYIDKKGFDEVENSINYRVISVKLEINQTPNTYKIRSIDEDENSIELEVSKGKEKIENSKIKEKFYNLDVDCEFLVDEVVFEDNLFIDDIEKLRKEIFEKLRNERKLNLPREISKFKKNNHPYYKKELTYLNNATNQKTQDFYKRHGVEKIETAMENLDDIKGKKVLTSSYCLRYELGFCSKIKPEKMPELPWKLEQIESGLKFRTEFDCKNCNMFLYLDE